jgi:hypothetical protein
MKGYKIMPRTGSRTKAQDPTENSTFNTSGLFLAGTIVQRTKREIPSVNPTTEVVTYQIIDDKDHNYYVDDYSPSEYHERGETVCLPVYVKAYKKKTGDASYSLNVLKPFRPSSKGVIF